MQINADGIYAVGVSTFPDFGFTGAGGDFGRYVLNISSYRGTILPVGDDAGVEVALSTFAFPFQGTNWSSVFVNGNGNLTFGAADLDFTESVAELLAGPPRIAPLWDDLNPDVGLVIAEEKDKSLQIHFVSVPEFLVTGTNYFSVTLDRRGEITMNYGATNRSDAIVGVTQGGGAADPGADRYLADLALRDREPPTSSSRRRRIVRRLWWSRSLVPGDYVQEAPIRTGSGRES